jgi:hypothetical protein
MNNKFECEKHVLRQKLQILTQVRINSRCKINSNQNTKHTKISLKSSESLLDLPKVNPNMYS